MRNKIKKVWQEYFNIVLVLLIPILSGFTTPAIIETSCPGLQVSVTSQSSGSAFFLWNTVSGASGYVVFYIRQGDNYSSQEIYTTNTSISYSGLPSGVYNFYFATVCGSELSEIIIVEDLVL